MILRTVFLLGVASAGAAYLPALGPVPLRFERAAVTPVALPPVPDAAPAAPVAMPAPLEPAGTTTRAASSAAEPLLTPALIGELLHRQKPGHDAPRPDVIVPFGFFPPAPGPRAGSSALYEVK